VESTGSTSFCVKLSYNQINSACESNWRLFSRELLPRSLWKSFGRKAALDLTRSTCRANNWLGRVNSSQPSCEIYFSNHHGSAACERAWTNAMWKISSRTTAAAMKKLVETRNYCCFLSKNFLLTSVYFGKDDESSTNFIFKAGFPLTLTTFQQWVVQEESFNNRGEERSAFISLC
jgi:hypothetical protein